MKLADQPPPKRKRKDGWVGVALLKMFLLVVMSVGLVWLGGWGLLAAPAFAAWYLFWPR